MVESLNSLKGSLQIRPYITRARIIRILDEFLAFGEVHNLFSCTITKNTIQ